MVDRNGDGLDDVTGWAEGVQRSASSPTGYVYNGIPVYADGRRYTGSVSGGQAVAGSQIPLDAESIRRSQADSALAAQQAANQNAYWQGSLAQQGAATAQQAAASAQRHEEAMAQYALQGAIAERQYQVDLAKFGLDVANFNWQKSKAAADMALQKNLFGVQTAQFDLSQNQFNASQRQAKEGDRKSVV